MRRLILLFAAAFMLNSCQNMKIVNKDPKARYIVASKTLEGVFKQLVRFRTDKIISNDNDWARIKIVSKQASEAFDIWGESVKTTGVKDPDIEKIAMDLLYNLQKYEKTYKATE